MTDFEDIRPYNDSEVPVVINRLIKDRELHDLVLTMKYPRLKKWFRWPLGKIVEHSLRKRLGKIDNVSQVQFKIVSLVEKMLAEASSSLKVTGLDQLDSNKPCLFIGNHRDIAMDPALVCLALTTKGRDTVRIAIGDNLLTKQFTSDLMRLNKSFIVKRSVEGKRNKFNALMQLSNYIRHSLLGDNSSIWIAQREGRAKDGIDKTDTALIKMLMLSKAKEQSFREGLSELNLVPIAISYELDPCDRDKARELHAKRASGGYEKAEHEDLKSIYRGLVGAKGHIHVAFGQPITNADSPEEVAAEVDRQIYSIYHLQPTNILAYEKAHGSNPAVDEWKSLVDQKSWAAISTLFEERLQNIDESFRDVVIDMYANPVCSRLNAQNKQ